MWIEKYQFINFHTFLLDNVQFPVSNGEVLKII